ncbi:hypothetical protein FSP39_009334 [Pinctada imbricata]|uniref:B box-type domain-containing protein n=1 Tax=Pinctada imbricata TaxID=66713 RepID=A0AA88YUX2_PINIB|nr:hypothetical protein FSP39_009334 [Pinctada imbricata]
MASEPLSERLCEPCKEGKKDVKARTLCYECHVLLCEPCSDYHQRLKSTKDHHLVDLVPFIKKSPSRNEPSTSKQKPSTFREDKLTSDFLKTFTIRDDTVLYHGAQVAMESTSVTSKPEKPTVYKKADQTRLRATKCLEFSVKRLGNKENVDVKGVLCVSDKVVVVDRNNNELKLFNKNGAYLSFIELKDYTFGITYVHDSTFATCGLGNTVFLWKVRGMTIVNVDVSYLVNPPAHGIHYNGTYYCVVHNWNNLITILNRHGRQVRKIILKEACGNKFKFGHDIHMDSETNNIYVPCHNEHGVLCTTIDGKALWFTPLSSPGGITEIQGTLCVVGHGSRYLYMITKVGENVGKLNDLDGKPGYVYYGLDGRLYVSYNSYNEISVYTITLW